MIDSSSQNLVDQDGTMKSAKSLIPAPLNKRVAAFAMDFVLLLFILVLAATVLLKFSEPGVPSLLNNLSSEFLSISQNQNLNPEDKQNQIQKLITPEISKFIKTVELWFIILPVTFFFIGEKFFSGKSFGKGTFGLKTTKCNEDENPTTAMLFLRVVVKGLSITFFFPFFFLLNYFFCFFNRERRCLHDLISGTMTIQEDRKQVGFQ